MIKDLKIQPNQKVTVLAPPFKRWNPSAEKLFKIVNKVIELIRLITPYKYKRLVVIFDNW